MVHFCHEIFPIFKLITVICAHMWDTLKLMRICYPPTVDTDEH